MLYVTVALLFMQGARPKEEGEDIDLQGFKTDETVYPARDDTENEIIRKLYTNHLAEIGRAAIHGEGYITENQYGDKRIEMKGYNQLEGREEGKLPEGKDWLNIQQNYRFVYAPDKYMRYRNFKNPSEYYNKTHRLYSKLALEKIN